MATYVPGVPQYLPSFTPFTPDYKFLSNVLDTKTQKYNTNYKALNDLYSKVVYGDLSRKDTKAMREQFTQNLGPRLEQISGMDLSMMQNAEAAKSIFKPFFEEDLIVKDLVSTKIYRNEMSNAEALKNNPDQKMRTMYWQEGVQKMQYEMEDFVNATEEDALKMAAPKYVPDADLTEAAVDFLKESGLKMSRTEPSKDGLWMIKKEQGDLVTREGLQMVQAALMDDPRVVQAYHAKAFVESRQAADKGIKEGKYQTVNQGQVAWAADKISDIEAKIAKRTVKLEKEEVGAENTSVSWEVYRKQHGIVKGSKEEKLANESWSRIKAIRAEIGRNKDALSGSKSINASNPEEVVPENKQKLLYRAYGLMMNYNMQSDLQAGAIQYSNIGKKIDLEVNPYGKMRVQNQYDMNKIRARGIEDRKTIDHELSKTKADARGRLDFLQDMGAGNEEFNTNEAEVDENRNLDSEYDYQEAQDRKFLDKYARTNDSKIDVGLSFLKSLKGNGNNNSGKFFIDGIGTESLPKLQQLMKTTEDDGTLKYQTEIDAFYDKMSGVLNNVTSDVASLENGEGPNLVTSANADQLAAYRKQFFQVDQAELGLNAANSTVYSTLDKNLNRAMQTELNAVDGANGFGTILNANPPRYFYKDEESGLTKRYTKEEYRKVFSDWAQSDQNQSTVTGTPFDDSGYFSANRSERTQNAQGDMAKLGYGQTPTKISSGGVSKGGMREPDRFTYRGAFSFQQDMANEQADQIYDAMYNLTNHSANGGLETLVSPESSAGSGDAGYTKMFDSPDIEQLLRGVDVSQMTAGDVTKAAVYEVIVDPFMITDESADMVKQIHNVLTKGDYAKHIYMDDVSFNRSQQGDTWNNTNASMLDPGDEINKANFPAGEMLLKQWMGDLNRMQGPTPTKSDYPGATVKYYSSWTSNPDELKHEFSGYTVTFDEDYIDQYRNDGGILEGLTGSSGGKTLMVNVVIPKGEDKNPRRSGELNFSSVATQISSSENANYTSVVPIGGSLNVIQDNEGMFNISTEIQQFDAETGGWTSADFSKVLTDDNNNPITVADRRYLDYYVNEYVLALEKAAKQNLKDKEAWILSNPQAIITDPIYRYK